MPRTQSVAQPVTDRLAIAEGHWHMAYFAEQTSSEHAKASVDALVDRDELAWLRTEEIRAEPYEEVLFALIAGYACTSPGSTGASVFTNWVRKLGDDAGTPAVARRECYKFLAAPDAWSSVVAWRKRGTSDGI